MSSEEDDYDEPDLGGGSGCIHIDVISLMICVVVVGPLRRARGALSSQRPIAASDVRVACASW
jgi:hypothetical protein